MKKIFTLSIVIVFLLNGVKAQYQVLGPGTTVSKKSLYLGLHPYIQIFNGDNTEEHSIMGSNLMGGYGFKYGIEANLRVGILYDSYKNQPDTYNAKSYNAGVLIKKHAFSSGKRYDSGFDLALGGGVHSLHGRVGFDAVIDISLRNASKSFFIYTGFDFDMNEELKYIDKQRTEKYFEMCYWVPIGFEIKPNYKWGVIIEGDIPLTSTSHYTAGIGLRRYFINKEKGLGK